MGPSFLQAIQGSSQHLKKAEVMVSETPQLKGQVYARQWCSYTSLGGLSSQLTEIATPIFRSRRRVSKITSSTKARICTEMHQITRLD
jgi:hypothetical protein